MKFYIERSGNGSLKRCDMHERHEVGEGFIGQTWLRGEHSGKGKQLERGPKMGIS